MSVINLTTQIYEFLGGNTYIADSILDFAQGHEINISGDCVLCVNMNGSIQNVAFKNTNNHNFKIQIQTTNNSFINCSFTGECFQDSNIIVDKTISLEQLTLPIGFMVTTLCFENTGDDGQAEFKVIPYADLHYMKFLYPFDPKDTISPIWVYVQKKEYTAESLGIYSTKEGDKSCMETNSRRMERAGGRGFPITLKPAYYYMQGINATEFKDWKGNTSGYTSLTIKGNGGENTQSGARSVILTDWGDFTYSLESKYHYILTLENVTICHQLSWFTVDAKVKKRSGYGMVVYKENPSISKELSKESELTLITKSVRFWGFWAAFWAAKWSTACRVIDTTFSGCRYGFYTGLAGNLSYFEGINIHNCAFGFTGGGHQVVIKRIELTPENIYRDEDAIATEMFYGFSFLNGYHNASIEELYLEDYAGDLESRQKFCVLRVCPQCNVSVTRSAFQEVTSDSAAYHLKLIKPSNYPYNNLQLNRAFIKFYDTALPVKVITDENWVLTGIASEHELTHKKSTYTGEDGGSKAVEVLFGTNTPHYWAGKPSVINTGTSLKFMFDKEDHIYYNALENVSSVLTDFAQLHNSNGSFWKPYNTNKLNLQMHIRGKTKIAKDFILKIGEKRIRVKVDKYDDGGVFDFELTKKIPQHDYYEWFLKAAGHFDISIPITDDINMLTINDKWITIDYFKFILTDQN